jgi:hypothetical protein
MQARKHGVALTGAARFTRIVADRGDAEVTIIRDFMDA